MLHQTLVDTPGLPSYFYLAMIGLAVLVQGVLGGLLAARHRRSGLLLGQAAALTAAAGAVLAQNATVTLAACVSAFRLSNTRRLPCAPDLDAHYYLSLFANVAVKGAFAALVAGVLVLLVSRLGARLPSRWRALHRSLRAMAVATSVTLIVAAGMGLVSTLSANGDPAVSAATPSPSVGAAPSGGQSSGRVLSQAEASQVANAFAAVLPAYWHVHKPSPEADLVMEPAGCAAVARHTYLNALADDLAVTATADYIGSDGTVFSSLRVTVMSYTRAVPTSVFDAADAARAACPSYSYRARHGLRLNYAVSAGTAPDLGERAWRTDQALSASYYGTDYHGNYPIVLVGVGHTLILFEFSAFREPLDEDLFARAMARAVQSVP